MFTIIQDYFCINKDFFSWHRWKWFAKYFCATKMMTCFFVTTANTKKLRQHCRSFRLIELFETMKMFFPVRIVQAGNGDASGRAGVDELIVAEINSHVGNPGFVRIFKEYEITDLRVVRHIGTVVIPFCR